MQAISKKFTLQSGVSDDIAEKKRKQIVSATDNLLINGKKYYVSNKGNDANSGESPDMAWQTLGKLKESRELLKPGDAVLFERGSIFRQDDEDYGGFEKNAAVLTVSGVTYGAYGAGDKPTFYGSSKNYADKNLWQPFEDNIWQMDFQLPDAGIIVFNGGESVGAKKWNLDDVMENGDFFHDNEEKKLYLYLSSGNPGDVFADMEIGVRRMVFLFDRFVHDVTIDNVCIKYVGSHAIQGGEFNRGITVTNCEIGWVGGSFLPTRKVRYGNGIQFWNDCSEIDIHDCYVYQVYDAGLTFQGACGAKYKNIAFENNLIEYCNYSIEFFIQSEKKEDSKTRGMLQDIKFNNNIMRFAGYGICELRPNHGDSCQICGWITDVDDELKNFYIENNVFDLSAHYFVYWLYEACGAKVSANSFYLKQNVNCTATKYGKFGVMNANNQSELEKAVACFDEAPKEVKWIEQ